MSNLNDIALITQTLLLHNQRAFEKLVKKYHEPIRRFFLNQTCGDSYLSDDLAQDTFIKAYIHLGDFKQLSNFSTWLFRIAYNVFYDYIRSQKTTEELDKVDIVHSVMQKDIGNKLDVYKALSLLKPDERTCIILHYMEDQPIEKIAKITGHPAGTIKSHLSRGKQKMSDYLKENGYGR